MLRIGCHLSSSKGYRAMAKDAKKINANTFQFFTRNPRGGNAKAIDDIGECMEEYKEYNPAVEYAVVPNTKLLPHLEKPAEVFDMIQTYLS